MRLVVVAIVLAQAGCGAHPSYDPCSVRCGSGTACPSGLSCGGDGFCYAAGQVQSCGGDIIDARGAPDGTGDGGGAVDSGFIGGDGPAPDSAIALVECGDQVCEICCACPAPGSSSCTTGCIPPCAIHQCDGPEDCMTGEACCRNSGGSQCQTTCSSTILCHGPTDCPGMTSPMCCPDSLGFHVCQEGPCPM